ncbi:MAG: type IV pilus assembly protein PilM [Armatimonadetes bacterium]|nr:type IV pilus assembly protein PilM [Armatimonadota bacterium]
MGLFAKSPSFGIDIGHHAIKVVQAERIGNQWKVVRFGEVPTPPDALRDGVVVDQDGIGFAIKQLLRDTGIHGTNCSVAVSGGSVVVRNIRIPKMSEQTLRKSIKFEASRYVPNSVEDSFIEFEILGDADEAQMDVLVVAAPRELVTSRIRTCESIGLEVEAVDIEAFASYRSLIEFNQDRDYGDSTVALVDIGASTTNMSVIQKNTFVMSRSISNGGQVLSDALKNYFKLSDADAESGKAQLDVTDLLEEVPHENPPLRVVQPHLDDLIREVRRSLNYFQSQQGDTDNRQVNSILLTGGGARLQGIAKYLEAKLGIPTFTLGLMENPNYQELPMSPDQALDFSVATGLAMRSHVKAA